MTDLPGGLVGGGAAPGGGDYAPPGFYGDARSSGRHVFSSTYQNRYTPYVGVPASDTLEWRRGGAGHWYSRFWVVLGPDMPWLPLRMPFVGGPETTLGSTATPKEIRTVKRQILKWKAPHGYPVQVVLAFEGVVLLGRRGLTMPFICPAFSSIAPVPEPRAPYCTWKMGKTMNDTLGNMPFVCGGFEV